MKTRELCLCYIDSKLSRDGEVCTTDLIKLFGMSRQTAMLCMSQYKSANVDITYNSSQKRHIAGRSFAPSILSVDDASLFCDMTEMVFGMLPSSLDD